VFHAPFEGVVLYGAPARRAVVGTIDGAGFLDVPLHVPELGPGVEATTRHMQALFRDVAGQAVLSWPVTQVVLDQAF